MADSVNTPTKPRRRWRRRLAIALLAILLLIVLAPLALRLGFVRDMVADAAGEALNREVTIARASAFWFSGIDLEGIVVKSPEGFDEPLATVKQVHVDVDLLELLGGDLDVRVRVESPRVTFLQDTAGRRNTDGLGEKRRTAPREEAPGGKAGAKRAEEEAPPRVRLQVVDGIVRARSGPGRPFDEVKDLRVTTALEEDGLFALDLDAAAVGAASGGGDAKIEVGLRVSRSGEGPVRAKVPPIDLSRLAGIVEGATGYGDLRGTVSLDVDATLRGRHGASGTVRSEAHGFVLRAPSGLRLAWQRMRTDLAMSEREGGGTGGELTLRIEHVEVLDDTNASEFEGNAVPRRFREPLIQVTAKAVFEEADERVLVEQGGVNAGRALAIQVSKPWEIHTGEKPDANGELTVQADLGQLSNLEAFVPALAEIERGGLGARVTAEAKDGLDVRAGIRVSNLELRAGTLSPEGHVEPELVAYAQVKQPKGDGPLSVILHSVTSSVLNLGSAQGEAPLELRLAEAGFGAAGTTRASIDLGRLGAALGGALGLRPGDRLGGVLTVAAQASLEPDAGRAELTVDGRDMSLPARFAEGVPPAVVRGRVVLANAPARRTLQVPDLNAFGLGVEATVAVSRGERGGLESANARVVGDLARARSLLAPLLGLGAGERLQGRLDASTKMVVARGTKRLEGRLSVTGLRWLDRSGQTLLDEPKVEVDHDVALVDGGDLLRFTRLALTSQALTASVTGSASTAGDAATLDAKVTLGGDAGRLAGIFRRRLGPDYRDLTGRGRLDGSLAIRSGTADSGRVLLVNGTVRPGDWSSGGLALTNAVLRLDRQSADRPQAAAFDGVLNKGSLDFDLALTPSPGQVPWSMTLKVARVDTAPIAVSQGLGAYLGFLLPTLVPTDAQTQVLSGLLDADIEMRAASLDQPRLDQTLSGKGFVKMDRGAIGESTLFRTIGGGRGLGDVGNVLARAVPEVGSALASLQKSLTFNRLESHFQVANRVVKVVKGLLDGERTRIAFWGTVGFHEAVNLKMDVTLGGKAGERLAKVMPSRKSTIPMTVTGTLAAPRIQPDLDAAGLAGGALRDLLPKGDPKDALDRLKDLLPK